MPNDKEIQNAATTFMHESLDRGGLDAQCAFIKGAKWVLEEIKK